MLHDLYYLDQQYRHEREQEAQRQRLILSVRDGQRPVVGIFLVWAGRRLVGLGNYLEARANAPAANPPLHAEPGIALAKRS